MIDFIHEVSWLKKQKIRVHISSSNKINLLLFIYQELLQTM
jgi:hypothetical protein